jgi:hypothetical protein
MTQNKTQTPTGLKFKRHFTREGIRPEDMFTYELRSSVLLKTRMVESFLKWTMWRCLNFGRR